MELIKIEVINPSLESTILEIPTGISLSLMEALKASGYDIPATCGGIALCATCQIEVLEGLDSLSKPSNAELDMLDTLPILLEGSRLSCQLRIGEEMEGLKIRILN
jgi:ferredoxin